MNSHKNRKIRVLVIQGPTASGKSDLALELSEAVGGEIVNADSMQVYRGMDIGTAKPSPDLQKRIPHHLLDIVTPEMNFSAGDFRREAVKAIADIHLRGAIPVVAGGTGLYVRALLKGLADLPAADEGYRAGLHLKLCQDGGVGLLAELSAVDPDTAATLHPNDHVRIIRALEVFRQTGIPVSSFREKHRFLTEEYETLRLGIRVDREELYRRIDFRVDSMISSGFTDEVKELLNAGYASGLKSMRSIGYREICSFLAGEYTLEKAVELMKRNTRRYAKRQETWLRTDPEIIWVEYPKSFATILNHVHAFLL